MVEQAQNFSQHAVQIAHDIQVGDAQDAIALPPEKCVTGRVVGDSELAAVGIAVNLDDQAALVAAEIHIVAAKRDQATEMMAEG